MKRSIAAIACGAFLLAAHWFGDVSAAQKDSDPAEFIRSLGGQVIETLEDDSLSKQARTQRFYDLFQESFNNDRISSFALGKYRRTIAPDRFDEYRKLFGKYMTGLYAMKFASYSGEAFVVTGTSNVSNIESDVTAEIRRPKSGPIRLTFRIDREGKALKIYDVVVEGISLLFAKRQEITSVIARDGMDQLIERLREAVQLAELQ